MRFMLFLSLLTAAALLLNPSDADAVTFDDGQLHVIDAANTYPFEDVNVEHGPGGAPTTVHVVVGGQIATLSGARLDARGSSIISVSGGLVRCRSSKYFGQGPLFAKRQFWVSA
jgi:hypothetical protein